MLSIMILTAVRPSLLAEELEKKGGFQVYESEKVSEIVSLLSDHLHMDAIVVTPEFTEDLEDLLARCIVVHLKNLTSGDQLACLLTSIFSHLASTAVH